MRKIVVLALLVAFLIPVVVFSASADTISVDGCYWIDSFFLCKLISDRLGFDYTKTSSFFSTCQNMAGSFTRLQFYEDILGVGCVIYDDCLYFEFDLVSFVSDFEFCEADFLSTICIDGAVWGCLDTVSIDSFESYSVDPWPDIAPYISISSGSAEHNVISSIVSDSGIDSVLDYILVILPVAIGVLVTYISVRKGVGYLRSVLNGS